MLPCDRRLRLHDVQDDLHREGRIRAGANPIAYRIYTKRWRQACTSADGGESVAFALLMTSIRSSNTLGSNWSRPIGPMKEWNPNRAPAAANPAKQKAGATRAPSTAHLQHAYSVVELGTKCNLKSAVAPVNQDFKVGAVGVEI